MTCSNTRKLIVRSTAPRFISRLETTPVAYRWWGKVTVELVSPLIYDSRVLAQHYPRKRHVAMPIRGKSPNKLRRICVPMGSTTDFASVPRFFWIAIPNRGKSDPAAALHDWLYRTGLFSRRIADLTFAEAMLAEGENAVRRRIMYWAVVNFGAKRWRKYREEEKDSWKMRNKARKTKL